MDIRPGTTLDGPGRQQIVIHREIGKGGFGQVFLGHLPDGTPVAVKTVPTAMLDDNALRVFQNELALSVGIDHANVVRVMYVNDGADDTGRAPYLVMEYVDNGTLRRLIEDRRSAGRPLSPDELRTLYLQIADGMAAVNEKVVHRDLKPDNVLVDANGGLKVADFGLAKVVDATTRSATFKGWGTTPYQAPEAFDGGPNTIAMDVYAGGVLYFELATFGWPIEPRPGDGSAMAWRNAHLLTPPKDVRAHRPDLPPDMAALVVQMLQKDSRKRPQSWATVADRLRMAAPPAGSPDVTSLVRKATAALVQRSEAETKAREAQERFAERTALLEQAFADLLATPQALAAAFNQSSDVAQMELRRMSPLSAEIRVHRGSAKLQIEGAMVDDINIGRLGVVRLIAQIALNPAPRAKSEREAIMDRESFGSFNAVYIVRRPEDRYGDWRQFRFEMNPLAPQMTYPRWFALSLADLPRQMTILNAVNQYQHEQLSLNDEWFRFLMEQLL